ncbi:MAG: hypothetical protein NVSMB23_03190 [Myxococcales bacterium]
MAMRRCAAAAAVLFWASGTWSCGDGGKQLVRAASGIALLDPPSGLDFGAVALGREERRTITVTNAGQVALSVALLADAPGALAANAADFEIGGLPLSIPPGRSAPIEIRYHPKAIGPSARALLLPTSASTTLRLDLRGKAVLGRSRLSADVLDFGDVVQGEDSRLLFTLTNDQDQARSEARVAAVAGSAAFQASFSGARQLSPGEAMTVEVRFAPRALGEVAATIDVVPCPTCAARPVVLRGAGVTRLVDVSPAAMEFGFVRLAESPQKPFTITNRAKKPLALSSLVTAGDASFTIALAGGSAAPLELAPGATLAGTVTFQPVAFGAHVATTTATVSDGAPGLLSLSGTGVGARLEVKPPALTIGPAIPDTTRSRALAVGNLGFDPQRDQPLVITGIAVESLDPRSWSFRAPPLPWTVGGPGQTGSLQVDFSPHGAGVSNAVLVLTSSDPLHPRTPVRLSSRGRILRPCTPRIEPAGVVEFGAVRVSDPSTQGFEIVNAGDDDCILGEATLVSDSASFGWPGGAAPQGRTLPPGGRMSLRVRFQPEAARSFSARVEMYLSNPALPRLVVNLHGEGDDGCFILAPGAVSFGSRETSCTRPDQVIYASNYCAGPVTVSALRVNRAAFAVAGAAPSVPFTIPQNKTVGIPVHYQAWPAGDDVAALQVTASTRATPYQAGLTTGPLPDRPLRSSWKQGQAKVDLLFVIDNSFSMAEEQAALSRNLGRLWGALARSNVDYHVAVTTTGMQPSTQLWSQCPGGASGGEAGRFFPVDASRPRILTPQTPFVQQALLANVDVGLCHWDERFLDPVVAALTAPLASVAKAPGTPWPNDGNLGFLRDDARLSLVVVSDADDANDVVSPPPVSAAVDQILAVKRGAADMISFAGFVPLSPCATVEQYPVPRYVEIQRQLGGHLEDVCNLAGFGALLDDALGDLLLPATSFPLDTVPFDPGQMVVRVDGIATSTWSYDGSTNRVVFPPESVPAPGASITADYESTCK